MTVLVDKNRCVGCGICTSICSDGIRLDITKGYALIVDGNSECMDKARRACPQEAITEINEKLKFAIGTDDEKTVKPDDHVGMSAFFHIFEYSDGEMIFKEKRENPKYKSDETRIHGDPGKAKATASVLQDVDVLIGKMMGPNIVRLKKQFVCVIVREKEISHVIDIIKENICTVLHEKNKSDSNERRGILLK